MYCVISPHYDMLKESEDAAMSQTLGYRLKKLREEHGINQEDLAKVLELDRTALSLIENDKRSLKVEQLIKISKFMNISTDELLNLESPLEIILEKEARTPVEEKPSIRISVPAKNLKKFKEVLLYVLSRVGAKPNVGETVLYKLLYFIDFNFYEKYEEQLMGATYIKNTYGPTPLEFQEIIKEMTKENELELVKSQYFQRERKKYLPRRDSNLTLLSATEIKCIDDVLHKLGSMNATAISEYSHKDVPWMVTNPKEIIDYETVFYRTPDYSVREYTDDDLR
jgi:transcriptional regulator with XRE-family HTH domain